MLFIVSFSKHKTHVFQDSHWYSHSLQLKICKIQKQKKDQIYFQFTNSLNHRREVFMLYAGEQSNQNTLH